MGLVLSFSFILGAAQAETPLSIINGGFQDSAVGSPPTGWTFAENFFWVGDSRIGGADPSSGFNSSQFAAAGRDYGGLPSSASLVGGDDYSSLMHQDIDLTPFSTQISAGDRYLGLSYAYYDSDNSDVGTISYDYFDSLGTPISTGYSAETSTGTNWSFVQQVSSSPVPANAATLRISLRAERNAPGGTVRNIAFDAIGASLMPEPPEPPLPTGGLVGFATLNGGTTGGGNGAWVTATTASQFINFATQSGPLNINVVGDLNIGGVDIASNKTIRGVGPDAGLRGSLEIKNADNVIVRNLTLSNPSGSGEGDTITVSNSRNVWIDHNDITNGPDGLLDIVRESDFVTASWNKFYYTDEYAQNVNTNHRFASLIGNSDSRTEDADNLRVTLHHNHWGDNVRERMPRVRYGDIHAFNEYYNADGNNYVFRSAIGAEVLSENSVFENVDDPYLKQQGGLVEETGNLFINTTGSQTGGDDVFTPPYEYTPDAVGDVQALVLAGAGAGNLGIFGDFNSDGSVDGQDLLIWQRGESPLPLSQADFSDWQANYGMPAALASQQSASNTVPEPSTLLLGLACCSQLACARRHRK